MKRGTNSSSKSNLTPSKTSNAINYTLKIKRGVAWSVRRVELDRERFKYFNPDNNELRFNEKIDDCNLLEKNPDSSKYYLRLVSKSNSFKDVKISSDDKELMKAFKNDFDSIINYKTSMSSIQNKTFIIESEKRADNIMRSEIMSSVGPYQNTDYDTQTIHKSVILGDNLTTFEQSVLNEPINLLDDLVNEPSTKNEVDITKKLEIEAAINNVTKVRQSQNEPSTESLIEQNKESIVEQPKSFASNQPEIKKETSENTTSEKWTKVKFSKNSIIEFNGEINKILPAIVSYSDEHSFKENYIKKNILQINQSLELVNKKQNTTLATLFVLFSLSMCLFFTSYLAESLVLSSLLFFIIRIYLKGVNFQDTKIVKNKEDLSSILSQEGENLNKLIRISSIFNENSKDMLTYLTSIKTFREWNLYVKGINDFKKEENSAKYIYANEDGDSEIKIKRQIISNAQPITIIDTLESDSTQTRAKLTILEPSIKGDKTKVTIYLNLKNVIEGRAPHSYIKSNLKCLDLLHVFINNKNFNTNNPTNEEDKELFTVKPNELNKSILSQSLTLEKENTLDMAGRVSIASKFVNHEVVKPVLNFQQVDNRFSEIKKEEKIEIVPEEIKQSSSVIKINTESPFDARESIKLSDVKVVEQVSINPLIAQENADIISVCNKKYSELDKFLNKEWKVMEEKKDFKSYYFDEANGLRSIKSEIVIEKNIKTVWDYLSDFNNKPKYDKNFDSGHDIRELDNTYTLQYLKYKGKMFISPRDFTIVTMKKIEENEYMAFATSYNSEKYPKVKGVERADLIYGGHILKRLEDFKTSMTYFTVTDLKLNQTLVNTTLKELAAQIKILKDILLSSK